MTFRSDLLYLAAPGLREAAREHAVVVGTTQVLSHAYEGVAPIPVGLFDLVIFDEAHHLPAPRGRKRPAVRR